MSDYEKAQRQRARDRLRRERLRAARDAGTHSMYEWCCLVAATRGICPRCKTATTHFDKDHVIPIYQGGSDAIGNIQPLCATCNASKGPERIDWFATQRQEALR